MQGCRVAPSPSPFSLSRSRRDIRTNSSPLATSAGSSAFDLLCFFVLLVPVLVLVMLLLPPGSAVLFESFAIVAEPRLVDGMTANDTHPAAADATAVTKREREKIPTTSSSAFMHTKYETESCCLAEGQGHRARTTLRGIHTSKTQSQSVAPATRTRTREQRLLSCAAPWVRELLSSPRLLFPARFAGVAEIFRCRASERWSTENRTGTSHTTKTKRRSTFASSSSRWCLRCLTNTQRIRGTALRRLASSRTLPRCRGQSPSTTWTL